MIAALAVYITTNVTVRDSSVLKYTWRLGLSFARSLIRASAKGLKTRKLDQRENK